VIVEVIAVGTEILLGQIVNTNAATIGSALAERGLDANYQQVVGDNLGRVSATIKLALSRSDAVIITGGIGPTQDDLTREAVCEATGLEMRFSEEYAEYLRQWFEARGRSMPASNLKQAEYPEGAEMLANPRGTAPGLAIPFEGKTIFCVPGVPAEMDYLLQAEVLPRLVTGNGEGETVLLSRLIRTWGQGESAVAEMLDDLYQSTNPSIAFLASAGEIKVRITAKADDRSKAEAMIAPVEQEVRQRLGDLVFGADEETIQQILLALLRNQELTIATAESMTGGLVAAALTSIPGSSDVVRGGLVAYDVGLKERLLGVADVAQVVTAEVAERMAIGARDLLGADVVVAVTGSAGPEPLEEPPGTFYIAVATPEKVMSRRLVIVGDREVVRAFAVTAALQLTRRALIGSWWNQ
jgi:nicotinamide-nucleotide amidase